MKDDIKQAIGNYTEQTENKASELWTDFKPHYTNLEPWQRGLVLITLLALLALALYYLTKKEDPAEALRRKTQLEAAAEERMLKRIELLKKLRE